MRYIFWVLLLSVSVFGQDIHCTTIGSQTNCTDNSQLNQGGQNLGAGLAARNHRHFVDRQWCLGHPGEISPSGAFCPSKEFVSSEMGKFQSKFPTFPQTPESANLIAQYLYSRGMPVELKNLEKARKDLLKHGMVKETQ